MTTNVNNPLERAAELLRGYAHELQQAHTMRSAPDDWDGEEAAKVAYDEHLTVASALEREAQVRACPLKRFAERQLREGLRARIAELEAQLASIGAGGVEPLRSRQDSQWGADAR